MPIQALSLLSLKPHLCCLARCLTTGSCHTLTKTFSQQDADAFVQLTGDSNPIHADHGRSQEAGMAEAGPILPGMLLASMFPAIIGSNFPGALYLSQTLKFRRSAAVGCKVLAAVTVTGRSGSRVTFDTVCKDALSGQVLVDGCALALMKHAPDQD